MNQLMQHQLQRKTMDEKDEEVGETFQAKIDSLVLNITDAKVEQS